MISVRYGTVREVLYVRQGDLVTLDAPEAWKTAYPGARKTLTDRYSSVLNVCYDTAGRGRAGKGGVRGGVGGCVGLCIKVPGQEGVKPTTTLDPHNFATRPRNSVIGTLLDSSLQGECSYTP